MRLIVKRSITRAVFISRQQRAVFISSLLISDISKIVAQKLYFPNEWCITALMMKLLCDALPAFGLERLAEYVANNFVINTCERQFTKNINYKPDVHDQAYKEINASLFIILAFHEMGHLSAAKHDQWMMGKRTIDPDEELACDRLAMKLLSLLDTNFSWYAGMISDPEDGSAEPDFRDGIPYCLGLFDFTICSIFIQLEIIWTTRQIARKNQQEGVLDKNIDFAIERAEQCNNTLRQLLEQSGCALNKMPRWYGVKRSIRANIFALARRRSFVILKYFSALQETRTELFNPIGVKSRREMFEAREHIHLTWCERLASVGLTIVEDGIIIPGRNLGRIRPNLVPIPPRMEAGLPRIVTRNKWKLEPPQVDSAKRTGG